MRQVRIKITENITSHNTENITSPNKNTSRLMLLKELMLKMKAACSCYMSKDLHPTVRYHILGKSTLPRYRSGNIQLNQIP
jgi:hypothetical protein